MVIFSKKLQNLLSRWETDRWGLCPLTPFVKCVPPVFPPPNFEALLEQKLLTSGSSPTLGKFWFLAWPYNWCCKQKKTGLCFCPPPLPLHLKYGFATAVLIYLPHGGGCTLSLFIAERQNLPIESREAVITNVVFGSTHRRSPPPPPPPPPHPPPPPPPPIEIPPMIKKKKCDNIA